MPSKVRRNPKRSSDLIHSSDENDTEEKDMKTNRATRHNRSKVQSYKITSDTDSRSSDDSDDIEEKKSQTNTPEKMNRKKSASKGKNQCSLLQFTVDTSNLKKQRITKTRESRIAKSSRKSSRKSDDGSDEGTSQSEDNGYNSESSADEPPTRATANRSRKGGKKIEASSDEFRRSSRKNKFVESMKEPKENSLSDLFSSLANTKSKECEKRRNVVITVVEQEEDESSVKIEQPRKASRSAAVKKVSSYEDDILDEPEERPKKHIKVSRISSGKNSGTPIEITSDSSGERQKKNKKQNKNIPDKIRKEKKGKPPKVSQKSDRRQVGGQTNKKERGIFSDESSDTDGSYGPETPDTKNKHKQLKSPKSPAVSHTSKRRQVKVDAAKIEHDSYSDYMTDESDDSSGSDKTEGDDIKLERILASRTERRSFWRDICSKINTTEIENGSRWFQADGPDSDDSTFQERFLIKWSGLSYLHCSWETEYDLLKELDQAKQRLSGFFKKNKNGILYDADDRGDGEYFHPSFTQVERILDVDVETGEIILDKEHADYDSGTGRQVLIKWGELGYDVSSYEFERDLILCKVEYEDNIEAFRKRNSKPTKVEVRKAFQGSEKSTRKLYKVFGDGVKLSAEEKEKKIKIYQTKLTNTVFKNGGQLRDYQAEGVSWMLSNHLNGKNCILADEMGLGKTVQTAIFLNTLSTGLQKRGPFLIIAPLSTIPHWYREFTAWTDLNTFIYHGNADSREQMRELEFAFEEDRPDKGRQNFLRNCHPKSYPQWKKTWMAQVVITTPETCVLDDFRELSHVEWDVLVVDEAHRMKNNNSKFASILREERFCFKRTLLLTGTPIQNNMTEMWNLLNFIGPDDFDDQEDFVKKYGSMQDTACIDELHELIRPFILRRLKEDVEKSVPPKEETLLEVELTVLQKKYYRALYEKNVGFLLKNKKKAIDGPSLMNLAMQLRKCCNHPFLLKGVEDGMRQENANTGKDVDEENLLVKASGKLVLLDKLLPRLQKGGHKVLIFSQFCIMLDILEDYLNIRQMNYERIDGSITGRSRQQAIDRFQTKEDSFIMMLSTRAGGVGINLTAADTCVIFDSDWNPQNDLQAQARCHRIGQKKEVKVYRLLSRKTYEMQMFHMSSLKMGLDQAVLGGLENGSGTDKSLTKAEIERLLRHGAYDMFNEENKGSSEAESSAFIEQDIDTILKRSKTVVHENTGSNSKAKGSTFSKASFKASDTITKGDDIDIDDPEFWTKMVGTPKLEAKTTDLVNKKRKRRTAVNYEESGGESIASDPYATEESFSSEDEDSPNTFERSMWGGKKNTHWHRKPVEAMISDYLMIHGYIHSDLLQITQKSLMNIEEVKRMYWALILTTLLEISEEDAREFEKREERAAKKKQKSTENTSSPVDVSSMDVSPIVVSPGGVLNSPIVRDSSTVDKGPISKQAQEENINRCLVKLWTANSNWADTVVNDATLFSTNHQPRSRQSNGLCTDWEKKKKDQDKEFPELLEFYTNIWPALKSRGWLLTNVPSDCLNRTYFSYQGHTFCNLVDALQACRIHHPELSKVAESLLESILPSPNTSASPKTALDVTRSQSIKIFLEEYGPLQLLADRAQSTKIPLQRRLLKVCMHMFNVRTLTKTASGDIGKLTNIFSMTYNKVALPHPKWTAGHDAALIFGLSKHGWIDCDGPFKSLENDDEVVWGHPFNKNSVPGSEVLVQGDKKFDEKFAQLLLAAKRACSFVQNHSVLLDSVKGFDREMILDFYRISADPNDWGSDGSDGAINSSRLTVNETRLQDLLVRIKKEETKFPSKIELLRRVKYLWETTINVQGTKKNQSQASPILTVTDFSTLDLTDPCVTLLVGLIRGLLGISGREKGSDAAWRKMLSLVEAEVTALKNGVQGNTDLDNIERHIQYVQEHSKPLTRPGKNVLRVILGIQPHAAKDSELFPRESQSSMPLKSSAPTKPKENGRKQAGSDLGIVSIYKAIGLAKSKNKTSNDHLLLSSQATLLLSSICSLGIPIWKEEWKNLMNNDGNSMHEFEISWWYLGEKYMHLATASYEQTKKLLMDASMELSKVSRSSGSKGLEEKCVELEKQLRQKSCRVVDVGLLVKNPLNLARTAIWIIGALRQRMGPVDTSKGGKKMQKVNKSEHGLGPKVLSWCSKEQTRWSQCLISADKDVPLSEGLSGPSAAYALFDKKACRNLFTQISQQTRLRSVFTRNSRDQVVKLLPKALKALKNDGHAWPDCSKSGGKDKNGIEHDYELLKGILDYGYSDFDVQKNHVLKSDTETPLTTGSIQPRINVLTRELGAQIDTAEAIKLLTGGINRNPPVTDTSPNQISVTLLPNTSGGNVQTGIDAFFAAAQAKKSGTSPLKKLDKNEGNSLTPGHDVKKNSLVMDLTSPLDAKND